MDNIAKLKTDSRITIWRWLGSSLAAQFLVKLKQAKANRQGRPPPSIST